MAMTRMADNGFDAAVVDRKNHPVALVEVKAYPVERWATILPKQLAKFAERVAFVFTIDPEYIQLHRLDRESLGEPIVRLDTREVLQHYDPEFRHFSPNTTGRLTRDKPFCS
jgi:hypothetical protein